MWETQEQTNTLQTSPEIVKISKIPVRLQKIWPPLCFVEAKEDRRKSERGCDPKCAVSCKKLSFLALYYFSHTQGICAVSSIRVYHLKKIFSMKKIWSEKFNIHKLAKSQFTKSKKCFFIPMNIRLKWWGGIYGTQLIWLPYFSLQLMHLWIGVCIAILRSKFWVKLWCMYTWTTL